MLVRIVMFYVFLRLLLISKQKDRLSQNSLLQSDPFFKTLLKFSSS